MQRFRDPQLSIVSHVRMRTFCCIRVTLVAVVLLLLLRLQQGSAQRIGRILEQGVLLMPCLLLEYLSSTQ